LSLIDLYKKRIGDNYADYSMKCGHKPVGLTKIWVNLHKQGVLLFNVEIECHNPQCLENPGFLILMNGDEGDQIDREVRSVPCCEKPKLNLVAIRGFFLTLTLRTPTAIPISTIFFSQDSICTMWRERYRGKVEDTIKRVNQDEIKIGDFPRITVTYKDNRLYTVDNRRLKVFKEKAEVDATPHMLVEVIFATLNSAMETKFTTNNLGISVKFRS